jgi:hypothetical protein
VFHGVADLLFRWRLELPVGHELNAENETRPPHVADDCKNRRGPIERDRCHKDRSSRILHGTSSIGRTRCRALTFVLLLEATEAVLEVGADDEGVLLEPLLLEHLEHGEPARGAQGVAAERVEVAAPGQHLRDLRRRHHGAQGDAVADALGNIGQARRRQVQSERRWHGNKQEEN